MDTKFVFWNGKIAVFGHNFTVSMWVNPAPLSTSIPLLVHEIVTVPHIKFTLIQVDLWFQAIASKILQIILTYLLLALYYHSYNQLCRRQQSCKFWTKKLCPHIDCACEINLLEMILNSFNSFSPVHRWYFSTASSFIWNYGLLSWSLCWCWPPGQHLTGRYQPRDRQLPQHQHHLLLHHRVRRPQAGGGPAALVAAAV